MFFPLTIFSTQTWILLVSIFVLIRLYIHKKWQVLKNLNIPHDPPTILGFGNLGELMTNPDNIFKLDLKHKEKHGTIYGRYTGLRPHIVVADPEILKQIFIKEFSSFRERQKTFKKINGKELNRSLLQASGENWKRLRATLTPTFSSAKLKAMRYIIEDCAGKMMSKLHKVSKEKDGRFDAKEIFGNLSMDVLCSAAFSADVHSQVSNKDEESSIVLKAKEFFNTKFLKNPLFIVFLLFPSTERIAEMFNYSVFGKDLMKYFTNLVDALIENKKHNADKSRVDIMQLMLEAEVSEESIKKGITKGLTKTEIIGNSILMLLAGYDTTGNAMLFLAYNLATHKLAQEKLHEEIDALYEEDGEVTFDSVSKLKYLTMCINESLRLYYPIGRNSRQSEKDITINGIHIPKNVQIDVPVYGLSHDEEYWDEPFQFKPERMEDMSKIDPMVFQPFGAGPRNCIGMRFALMEIRVAFCKLLREFSLTVCQDTPEPPLEVTFKASMQPKQDVYLKVVPRNVCHWHLPHKIKGLVGRVLKRAARSQYFQCKYPIHVKISKLEVEYCQES